MQKALLTGDEAAARGAYEAGVRFASAYPGTPSTEILENVALYKDDILAEWAPNEKVALENGYGACIAGARTLVCLKHVGLNVAADPFFTISYEGVNGGLVIVCCDEPGHFSSQNEQDNRNYAKAARMPMFEPSNSQEAKDMMVEAFRLSEELDTPVFFRMTTRVCHGKGIVQLKDRDNVAFKDYNKNAKKYVAVPAFVTGMRDRLEERMHKLQALSDKSPLNRAEYNSGEGAKTGVIVSGICYHHAKEVWGDKASYLKLGFTNPMPDKLIKEFCSKFKELYVIEENDPYMEDHIRMLGFNPKGYGFFPVQGERTSDIIRKYVFGSTKKTIDYDKSSIVGRPPTFCAGCPHRGFFYELGKRKDIIMCGDIGCYALAASAPYNAEDTCLCMGASLSMAHGMQQMLDKKGDKRRALGFLGDSTFFHTGVESLIGTGYNQSRCISVVLDNRITGMTGHQQNPGTGFTLQMKPTKELDVETLAHACGIEKVFVVNPNKLDEVKKALDEAVAFDGPSMIITRWPCVLKKLSQEDKTEWPGVFKVKCQVNHDACIGCKACLKTGCPALSFNADTKKVTIDKASCVGCEVCAQVCPKKAISKEESK
jgi:indolepyruvate ferredoxin oxidoreductase alpha subunit